MPPGWEVVWGMGRLGISANGSPVRHAPERARNLDPGDQVLGPVSHLGRAKRRPGPTPGPALVLAFAPDRQDEELVLAGLDAHVVDEPLQRTAEPGHLELGQQALGAALAERPDTEVERAVGVL